jgi:protoporphyrin/coproporphyrin ferrochelatase
MSKRAVLLLAHGTPESVEQVPEYLRNVVSGRPVPEAVVQEIAHRYALIGKSPLTEITMEQARLVEEELKAGVDSCFPRSENPDLGHPGTAETEGSASHPSDKNKDVARVGHPEGSISHPSDKNKNVAWMGHGEGRGEGSPVRVYVGMRNWKPYIADVVRQMRADGVEEAAVLCMAPQNSRTSVGLYRRAVEAEAQGLRIDFTEGWARHPLLVEAFAERLRPAWRKLSEEVGFPAPVLFTAHSVPKRTVEMEVEKPDERSGPRLWPGRGVDPYAEEARHTAELVAAQVPEIPGWRFAFQSQGASGGAWIGPSVEETLDGMAREGVKAVILQPIGFLCDHVEILFDVDRLFREYAARLGIRLERPESLNASPTLARAIADLARQGLARLAES